MKALEPDEPRTVGRYRLLALLGRGGMGRVFLGLAPDGRLAAIKQVSPSATADPEFRARFRREVQASRRVPGTHTAVTLDADTEAETPWMSSEYVPGPGLDVAVNQAGPLDLAGLRVLGWGLASALVDIHRAGLVHRDLKPGNVLLTDDRPILIDFGIARSAAGDGRITATGSVVGSPSYMSPEQVRGAQPGPAGDVFSLGSLLAFAATGTVLFQATATPQVLYAVVYAEPDLSGVPPELRPLVARCLAKEPEHRPSPTEIRDTIGGPTPGVRWLPAGVSSLITNQRAALRDLLGSSDVDGSAAATTGLQTGLPRLPSPPTRPALIPRPPPLPGPPVVTTPLARPVQAMPRPQPSSPPSWSAAPHPAAPSGAASTIPTPTARRRVRPVIVFTVVSVILVLVGVGIAIAVMDDAQGQAAPTPGPSTPTTSTTTTPAPTTPPPGPTTLDDPTIGTRKNADGVDLCRILGADDIEQATGYTRAAPPGPPLPCTTSLAEGGLLFIGQNDSLRSGRGVLVGGNSALVEEQGSNGCRVTVALGPDAADGDILDIQLNALISRPIPVCDGVLELARRALERLPDA